MSPSFIPHPPRLVRPSYFTRAPAATPAGAATSPTRPRRWTTPLDTPLDTHAAPLDTHDKEAPLDTHDKHAAGHPRAAPGVRTAGTDPENAVGVHRWGGLQGRSAMLTGRVGRRRARGRGRLDTHARNGRSGDGERAGTAGSRQPLGEEVPPRHWTPTTRMTRTGWVSTRGPTTRMTRTGWVSTRGPAATPAGAGLWGVGWTPMLATAG
jgi:hypothetical protein